MVTKLGKMLTFRESLPLLVQPYPWLRDQREVKQQFAKSILHYHESYVH